jgi:outer membrane protease
VPTTKSFLSACLRLAAAMAASLSTAAPARAADWSYRLFEAPTTYTAEAGLRFWYGRTTTAKNLYDDTGSLLVSRLTYGNLALYSAEAYVRFDFDRTWFLKGYGGGGTFRQGSLKDEDFPPITVPYSATFSVEHNSSTFYGSFDGGINVVWGPDFRVGVFAGVHYLSQNISAFGCSQTAFNPDICGTFSIPNQVRVITQDNHWSSIRLGVDAAFDFDRFRFSVDAAWVPFALLQGTDTHRLRIGFFPGNFTGPLPEDGRGWGYQIDAFLAYRVNEVASVGIGGRYWYMQTRGHTHFENHIIAGVGVPQVLEWKTENFGVFVQGSVKLGPYNLISVK